MKTRDREIYVRPRLNRTLREIENCYFAMSNQYLMSLDITLSQCEVLAYLYQSPSEKVDTGRLLEFLHIARPSLSITLNKLEQKGYIRYFYAGGDMRKKQVSLTIKAMEIRDLVMERLEHLESVLYNQLSEAECEEAYRILNIMLRNVSAYMERVERDKGNV